MNGGRDEHGIPRDGDPHPARLGPGPRRDPLPRPLSGPAARAVTWRDALSHAPGYALHVTLCYVVAGFLVDRIAGCIAERDGVPEGLYPVFILLSIVPVYPISVALGLACFRYFPKIMSGRRSRRAILTGILAAGLVWGGVGELLLRLCDHAYDTMPGMRVGWVMTLMICTPFSVGLSVAHGLALLLPSGPPTRVPVRRPVRGVLPGRVTK